MLDDSELLSAQPTGQQSVSINSRVLQHLYERESQAHSRIHFGACFDTYIISHLKICYCIAVTLQSL